MHARFSSSFGIAGGQLSWRLTQTFIVIIAVLGVIVAVAGTRAITESIERRAEGELVSGEAIMRVHLRQLEDDLIFLAGLYARSQMLTEQLGVPSASRSLLISLIADFRRRGMRVRIYDREPPGDSESFSVVQKGFLGMRTLSLVLSPQAQGSELWLVSVAPMESERRVEGVASVSFPLTVDYLKSITARIGSDITLLLSKGQTISTLPPAAMTTLVRRLRANRSIGGTGEESMIFSTVSIGKPTKALVAPLVINLRQEGHLILSVPMADLLAAKRSILSKVVLITLALLTGASLLYLFLIRKVTKPLAQLASATRDVAGGNLNIQVKVAGSDEVADLANAFNVMILQLRGSREEIKRWNRTLEQRVEERTQSLEIAHRTQQEETEVSRALAYVGQELLSSLDTPTLLDRLHQLTAEVLGCEFGEVILAEEREGTYVPTASYGIPPEHWEAMRVLELPSAQLRQLLAASGTEGTIHLHHIQDPRWLGVTGQLHITGAMAIPLRLHDQIIGALVAADRRSQEPFKPYQCRILLGIAQLASMALEKARLMEELQRANRVKSEFVSTMSHELRTPLNIILGYNDLLREHAYGPLTAEQGEALQRMDSNAQSLLEQINSLLDFSRLESGRVEVEPAEVHVEEVLHELTSGFLERQSKPGVQLTLAVAPGLPPVHTDSTKLKLIISNLITNALKFTESGTVTVRADRRDDGIEIEVADTGMGIAPEFLPVIFEPFRQVAGGLSRPYGGVGLGLHIVHRLVDLLGARIAVDSVLGRGSVFRVWLPRRGAET